MEVKISGSVQDNYLSEAKDLQTPMVVYMMNGFQMRGIIADFDDFSILVESDGKRQLVYKHAVSTIAPKIEKPATQTNGFRHTGW